MNKVPKLVVLVVLDGWGIAPASEGNGVTLAETPNFKKFVATYPAMTLLASGESVGLSWGEMGNSEVGHLNLGAGRIFYQNLPRISKAIADGSFFTKKALLGAVEHARKYHSRIHLIGLTSEGRVHSTMPHCYALLEFFKQQKMDDVFIHAILDGRDVIFNSGKGFIEELQEKMRKIGVGEIASLHGRMYAMDRDNRWERVEKVYRALVQGKSEEYAKDPLSAIDRSYGEKVFDEEFVPIVIGKEDAPTALVRDNDVVVFFNFRADRGRELTHAFVLEEFDKFNRGEKLKNLFFATMTEFEENLPVEVIFQKETVKTSLPKVLSERGLRQLHIAETEKYAHVTFFFSGGVEDPFDGEERVVIPSPKVASYASVPEMSAKKVTESLINEILKDKHDFIVVNYANPDMVGHTGGIKETIKSIEVVDRCLGDVVNLVLSKGGQLVITADHGNAEELLNLQTGEIDKEHSTNPVPCIIVGSQFEGKTFDDVQLVGNDLSLVQPIGLLSDVAPTILKMMGIDPPSEMTGRALV